MDLTKFGDFSTLFHQYGADVILYYEKDEEKPWVVSIVIEAQNQYWLRRELTYDDAFDALKAAYEAFIMADDEIVVVA